MLQLNAWFASSTSFTDCTLLPIPIPQCFLSVWMVFIVMTKTTFCVHNIHEWKNVRCRVHDLNTFLVSEINVFLKEKCHWIFLLLFLCINSKKYDVFKYQSRIYSSKFTTFRDKTTSSAFPKVSCWECSGYIILGLHECFIMVKCIANKRKLELWTIS